MLRGRGETKGRKEAEVSESRKALGFLDGRGWRSSDSSSFSQRFPYLHEELPGALVFPASASNRSNWEETGGQRSPGPGSLPPRERYSRGPRRSAAAVADVGGGQRVRPPGRGAELARTGAGMARGLSSGRTDTPAPAYLRPSQRSPGPPRAQTPRQLARRPRPRQL